MPLHKEYIANGLLIGRLLFASLCTSRWFWWSKWSM